MEIQFALYERGGQGLDAVSKKLPVSKRESERRGALISI